MPYPYNNWFSIFSTIVDRGFNRVGVRLRGGSTTHLILSGVYSNTFTGAMEVSGPHFLSLNKTNGATAIRQELILSNNAQVDLGYGGQFGRWATVRLNDAMFNLWSMDGKHIKEQFEQLYVTGHSELNFHEGGYYATGEIFLDDLFVTYWSELLIKKWSDFGETRLFVRKDSAHLEESLGRIKFDGKWGSAGVRSHNWEYWEIGVGFGFSKLPEPSTYGAIFGGVGLGLIAWRRRRNRRCPWRRKGHLPKRRKDASNRD